MEMSQKELICCLISDIYKEIYGMRPRFYDWDAWTYSELCVEFDRLKKELAEEMA